MKGMLSCCFAPNGFQFATSSDDNTVKIWDLRKQKSIYTVPAHNSVIPDVRFDKTGEFLVTCSFDHTVKGGVLRVSVTRSVVDAQLQVSAHSGGT